ncbi:MAG: hypothetical protein AB2653_21130, partial [Candidatus Thiodiazotropha endolucinida]
MRMFRITHGFVILLLLTVCIQVAYADVELPEGEYYQNIDDMTTQVLGGEITIRRTWYKGQWFSNRAWAPLKFDRYHRTAILNGVTTEFIYVLGAERNGDSYEPARFVVSNLLGTYPCIQPPGGNTTHDYYSDPVWLAACYEQHFGMFDEVGYTYALNGQRSAFESGETIVRTDTGY